MDMGTREPVCTVDPDALDALPPCGESTPPNSFSPTVEWEWWGDGEWRDSITTPMVANLTDDDNNGVIDLCDIPDILVMVHIGLTGTPERMYLLDGASGDVHWVSPLQFGFSAAPAIGDVDGDGEADIVAMTSSNQIVLLAASGEVKWSVPQPWFGSYHAAISLADLEGDGDVEIIVGNGVIDHLGQLVWNKLSEPINYYHTSTAADLDGDGELEVIIGRSAYRANGDVYYEHASLGAAHALVANFDSDPDPEILLTGQEGISMLEHTGAIITMNQTPTGDPAISNNWRRPAAAHDFNGNGLAEFAMSSSDNFAVYNGDLSIVWQASVDDQTGSAAGTAFDFLGDGVAEAIYGDETVFRIFDGGNGDVLLSVPRGSRTTTEYPVVADVDNDGSTEVVVVSESDQNETPTVQVIGEANGNWIPSRRIWNQHSYHVTNVREDGTIPSNEAKHWELLNTFRTQAQQEDGGPCEPPVR